MKIYQFFTEYIIVPFPDIQPEYWLKIELWKRHEAYRPIVYVRDDFRLTKSSLSGKKRHQKKYSLWVRDETGLFPEEYDILNIAEEKVIEVVLEVMRCNFSHTVLEECWQHYLVKNNESI